LSFESCNTEISFSDKPTERLEGCKQVPVVSMHERMETKQFVPDYVCHDAQGRKWDKDDKKHHESSCDFSVCFFS
jgi:hypothetical protein